MGKFSIAVTDTQKPKTQYDTVCDLLKKLDDGSLEELQEALRSKSITNKDIARAVYSTTGIRISDTTVRRWRYLHGDI